MKYYIIYMAPDPMGTVKQGPYTTLAAAKKEYKRIRAPYKSIIKTAQ